MGDSNPLLPLTDGCVYLLRLHDGRHLPPQRDVQHPGDGEAVPERLKRNASTAHYLDAAHAARIDLNRAAVGGRDCHGAGVVRGRWRRRSVVAAAAPCAPTRTGSISIIVTADRTQYAATCGSTSCCGCRTDWRRSKRGRGRCLSPSTQRETAAAPQFLLSSSEAIMVDNNCVLHGREGYAYSGGDGVDSEQRRVYWRIWCWTDRSGAGSPGWDG